MAYRVCGHISEDVIHAIRDFLAMRNIWNQLLPVGKHDSSEIIKASYIWAKQYISTGRGHVIEPCKATPCPILIKNWVCLNIDGVRHEAGFVAAGEILRDHNGKWLFGFNSKKRSREFCGGFQLCSGQENSSTVAMISICHIHREDNQDVDSLVNMVHERRHGLLMFKVASFRRRF
ncbi:hypothetical protein J1N35_007803 [Gossypium stocksii]|uniref:RNase H type-1 domain-containing protein n=1 Tax=Gossypium stocksii TaxID=47602 RepID=A0A9D3W952_9ROSI|nr:hypothetical protein J1N35_007803 [Gossypium stocksii]